MDTWAYVIGVAVVASQFLVPLLIIKYPLPAIIACLVIDAVDQTVFQAVAPDADLSGYQSYDKALDIYYLTIAYISTLRNWTSQFAVSIAPVPALLPPGRRGAVRVHRDALAPVHLPQHVRVLLHLLRGGPRALGPAPDVAAAARRRRRRSSGSSSSCPRNGGSTSRSWTPPTSSRRSSSGSRRAPLGRHLRGPAVGAGRVRVVVVLLASWPGGSSPTCCRPPTDPSRSRG